MLSNANTELLRKGKLIMGDLSWFKGLGVYAVD